MSSIIINDNERQESRLNDCKSATSIDKTPVVEAFQKKRTEEKDEIGGAQVASRRD